LVLEGTGGLAGREEEIAELEGTGVTEETGPELERPELEELAVFEEDTEGFEGTGETQEPEELDGTGDDFDEVGQAEV
jgi:hypothetical protein